MIKSMTGFASLTRDDEVAAVGPLSVRELSDPGPRTGPWWGQSRGKVALEWLYVSGRLAIAQRTPSFVTVYDLPERVIRPEVLSADTPDEPDAHHRFLDRVQPMVDQYR